MIQVGPPALARSGDRLHLRYRLQAPAWVGLQRDALVLTYPEDFGPEGGLGEAALYSLLPFAFWAGAHLRLDPALAFSEQARAASDRLCRTWGEWYRRPFALQIRGGASAPVAPTPAGQMALFFSGGVDSLATFLRQRDEVDALVFVRGSDLYLRPDRLEVEAKYQSIETPLRHFAANQGKEFFTLSTNVREVFGFRFRGEIWSHVAHGCATVATALPLAGHYPYWMISSSGSGRYETTFLTGTHPDLAPWLGAGRVSVTMPDTHLGRVERNRLIASHPGALAVLRVCSQETPRYNCGQCKKCVQAIASLLLASVRPGEAPFPVEAFNFDHVARLAQGGPLPFKGSVYWGEILAALDQASDLPAGGRRLAEGLRARLTFQPRYLRGEAPDASERLFPDLPGRPGFVQRLIGFPSLNHSSLRKWLKNMARARFGRRRLRAWISGQAAPRGRVRAP